MNIKSVSRVGIAIFLFGFFIIWTCCAIYGIVQLYDKPKRTEILEAWKERTVVLELKVEEYERITKVLPVLRQLLTPLAWLEIEALVERDRQKKRKENYENNSNKRYVGRK